MLIGYPVAKRLRKVILTYDKDTFLTYFDKPLDALGRKEQWLVVVLHEIDAVRMETVRAILRSRARQKLQTVREFLELALM